MSCASPCTEKDGERQPRSKKLDGLQKETHRPAILEIKIQGRGECGTTHSISNNRPSRKQNDHGHELLKHMRSKNCTNDVCGRFGSELLIQIGIRAAFPTFCSKGCNKPVPKHERVNERQTLQSYTLACRFKVMRPVLPLLNRTGGRSAAQAKGNKKRGLDA